MADQGVGSETPVAGAFEPSRTFKGRVWQMGEEAWSKATVDSLDAEWKRWHEEDLQPADWERLARMGRPGENRLQTLVLLTMDLDDARRAKDPSDHIEYVQQVWSDGHVEQGLVIEDRGEKIQAGLWVGSHADGSRSFTGIFTGEQAVKMYENDGEIVSAWGYRFTPEDHAFAREDGYANAGEALDVELGGMIADQRVAEGTEAQAELDRIELLKSRFETTYGETFDATEASPEDEARWAEMEARFYAEQRLADQGEDLGQLRMLLPVRQHGMVDAVGFVGQSADQSPQNHVMLQVLNNFEDIREWYRETLVNPELMERAIIMPHGPTDVDLAVPAGDARRSGCLDEGFTTQAAAERRCQLLLSHIPAGEAGFDELRVEKIGSTYWVAWGEPMDHELKAPERAVVNGRHLGYKESAIREFLADLPGQDAQSIERLMAEPTIIHPERAATAVPIEEHSVVPDAQSPKVGKEAPVAVQQQTTTDSQQEPEPSRPVEGRADLSADLTKAADAKIEPNRQPRGRLVRGVDLDQPNCPIRNAKEADDQAATWSKDPKDLAPGVRAAIFAGRDKAQANSIEFNRQKKSAVQGQIAEDYRSIGHQVEAAEGRIPGHNLVKVTHPDGSVEVGVLSEDMKRKGTWLALAPNGDLKERASFDDQGRMHGVRRLSDQHGHVLQADTYDHGVRTEHREYERGAWQKIQKFDKDGDIIDEKTREQVEQRQQARKRDFSAIQFGDR